MSSDYGAVGNFTFVRNERFTCSQFLVVHVQKHYCGNTWTEIDQYVYRVIYVGFQESDRKFISCILALLNAETDVKYKHYIWLSF